MPDYKAVYDKAMKEFKITQKEYYETLKLYKSMLGNELNSSEYIDLKKLELRLVGVKTMLWAYGQVLSASGEKEDYNLFLEAFNLLNKE